MEIAGRINLHSRKFTRVADAAKIGDIDVAVKVDEATFEKLFERFKTLAKDP